MKSDDLIQNLKLIPHPEGGWFRRTFSSQHTIDLERGKRSCSTSILYFLKPGEFSRLHCLASDEIWYFHYGSPLKMHLFHRDAYETITLGNDVSEGQIVQKIINADTVFGAEVSVCQNQNGSLLSCSVTPGYDNLDFRWDDLNLMLVKYPNQASIIRRLAPCVSS